MATSSATARTFLQQLLDDPQFERVKALSKLHPDLPKMLVGVAGQSLNPDLATLLNDNLGVKGRVQGRAGSGPKAAATVRISLPEEKQYVRPNGEVYIPRKWGDYQDVIVLRRAALGGKFVLLYGPPGTGKTALFEAAFSPKPFYTVLGTGDTEVADLIGGYVPTEEVGVFRWVDGPLLQAAEEGVPLLIDEVGLIDPKVMSVVYSAMDGRGEIPVSANPARGTVKIKEGFYIVGATNPNAPGVRLSEALLSRFQVHVEVVTDFKLARELGVPADIAGAAEHLYGLYEKGVISWSPQMRDLLAFRDLTNDFGKDFAAANLIASAPPGDRNEVAEKVSRALRKQYLAARI
jgi:nitric oxide reductase NorQ protein